jgi:heavy metal sensor kinase
MPLSIRARIAVSYGLVIVTVLLVVAVAVSAVHQRLGLTRIDADLRANMRSVAGVVGSEIDERSSLPIGAHEALYELELPGFGVMVFDQAGTPLATRVSGAPAVPVETLRAVAREAAPRTLAPERVRLAASSWSHGEHNYRVVVWTSLVPFDREHATVQNTIRASIPLAALAALMGGWLIVWRALRPLSQMAAVADSIDRRRFDARLPVSAPRDELRRLAVAFNALLDRLSEVVQAQRRFMADASHELRTPVTVARTAAQVTLAATRTEPEYREALDIISLQTDRLTHVVDDMFLLAVADAEGRPLILRYLYLDEMVGDCLRAAGVLAETRGVSLTLQAQPGVQLEGDEELLRRMMMNLLDNAIRYSSAGGRVRVTVTATDQTATVSVADSGPGIPASERDRVFERFVRLVPAGAASGSGLGLPIARWIAEQHGGTLTLDGSDGGTRVVMTLPLSPSGARSERNARAEADTRGVDRPAPPLAAPSHANRTSS